MRVLLGLLLAVLLVAVLGADEVQGILVKKCVGKQKHYAFPQTAEQCNAAAASLGIGNPNSEYGEAYEVDSPLAAEQWMKGCKRRSWPCAY